MGGIATMSELLDAAAPWICLVWLLGTVAVTLMNAREIRRDHAVALTMAMMPWLLVLVAVSCVAWPGLVIFAVLTRKKPE